MTSRHSISERGPTVKVLAQGEVADVPEVHETEPDRELLEPGRVDEA